MRTSAASRSKGSCCGNRPSVVQTRTVMRKNKAQVSPAPASLYTRYHWPVWSAMMVTAEGTMFAACVAISSAPI